MSFKTTESQLRSIFDLFCEIMRINVLTDRVTGKSRGFGCEEITNDAKAAAALNGRDVNGRDLNMHEACPKTDCSGPRGGVERYPRDDYRESAR